jgi:hypothetical protein
MSDRFTEIELTTISVGAGATVTASRSLGNDWNDFDVGKIKFEINLGGGSSVYKIYKEAAKTNLAFEVKATTREPYFDPVRNDGSAVTEGPPADVVFRFSDLDGGDSLHFEITNNAGVTRVYTPTIWAEQHVP